jgi:hypothetical protein
MGVIDTGAKLPPVSTISTAKLVAKFATSVVDTGGAPCLSNISANIRKRSYMGYSGAGGKLIHEKTRSKKLVALSL